MRFTCNLFLSPPVRVSGLLVFSLCGVSANAQVIDIRGITRTVDANAPLGYAYNTWKPVLASSSATVVAPVNGTQSGFLSAGGYMLDPINDQQTGQSDSDFVSSATLSGNTVTSVNPGFFIQFGTIDYAGTNVEHIGFRAMMNEYKISGNVVNIRFGLDANADGKIDLYIGLSQQNNQTGIVFNYPNALATPTSNTSPSTSNWGTTTYPTADRTGLPALNSNNNALALVEGFNYSNIQIADGVNKVGTGGNATTPADNRSLFYPGWLTQDEDNPPNNVSLLDAMVSFAVPLADVNAALAANRALQTTASYTPPEIILTSDSYVRWVAVTSTQNNSVNQDAYGFGKGDLTKTWTSMITPINGDGFVQGLPPVPEPSTYGLLGSAALVGFILLGRRRHPVRR